jgi:tetratricopeptide (TPR) repeat protein
MALLRLNWIEGSTGNLNEAERLATQALQLAQSREWREGMARAYSNLGVIYLERGDFNRAEEMELESLKLEEQLGRKEGIADSYCNLGCIYTKPGNLNRAEDMQQKSLKLNEELGRKEGMAKAYRNLGTIFWHRKDKAKMCECWRKARDLWRAMGLENNAAEAEVLLKQNGCA